MENVPVSHSDRTALAAGLKPEARPLQRAKNSNRPDVLRGVKHNSAEGRRYRDLVRAYLIAVDRDLNEIELSQLQDLAALEVLSERLHANGMNGKPVSVAKLCNLVSTKMRLASRLGLSRERVEETGSGFGKLLAADWERQQQEDRIRKEEKQRLDDERTVHKEAI